MVGILGIEVFWHLLIKNLDIDKLTNAKNITNLFSLKNIRSSLFSSNIWRWKIYLFNAHAFHYSSPERWISFSAEKNLHTFDDWNSTDSNSIIFFLLSAALGSPDERWRWILSELYRVWRIFFITAIYHLQLTQSRSRSLEHGWYLIHTTVR